ncbi:MAG: T9SS type A sorting domain-containing protein [Flavobacteriales bacterium]|nr:T9SS type A sorting domain-containing protein [Flavobacteriales bacterium]
MIDGTGSFVHMMKHHHPAIATLLALAFSVVLPRTIHAQAVGDLRSAGSGTWNALSSWEVFDGNDFVPIAVVPGAGDGLITIRAGHTITANTFLTADQVVVESGGTLDHTNGGFTVADGTGDDIQVFGSLIHSGNGFSGPGNIRIMSGGTFQWTGGGQLNADLVLDLDEGSTATSSSTSPLLNNGTINNGGTWTLVDGGFSSTFDPGTFHNLSTGIVELNGWASPTNSWALETINDGIINKNNGAVTFTTTGRPWTNNGTINVPLGTWRNSSSCTNAGEFAFGGTGTALRPNGDFTNTANGSITGLGHLQLQSGTCTMAAGSSMNALDTLAVATFSTLLVEQDIQAEQVNFTGGTINGTAAVNVANGGRFDWTGGNFNATLDVAMGAIATFNAPSTTPNLNNAGTINNAGTWNMDGGNLSQLGTVGTFNNGATGVVNLNNWQSTTNSWKQNTVNHGIIHKNNGAVQFSVTLPFTNESSGVVNVNAGTLRFANTAVLSGEVNIPTGASILGNANGVTAEGLTMQNDGSVTPLITFQGSDEHFLNGTGSLEGLHMNGTGTLNLGGTQTMSGTFTLTNGIVDLGDNDLVLTGTAAGVVVGGSEASHVRTSGSGSLRRPVSGSLGSFHFPVGLNSYTPLSITLTNGQPEQFAVRVRHGVHTTYDSPGVATGSLITSDIVGRTWIVGDQVPGGETIDVTLQWNAADELSGFTRSNSAVARFNGDEWITAAFGSASGTGPFTRTFTGLTFYREFCVADADAELNDVNTAVDPLEVRQPLIGPNPANDRIHIRPTNGGTFYSCSLLDANGKRVVSLNAQQVAGGLMDVSGLSTGCYIMEVIMDGAITRWPVMVAH